MKYNKVLIDETTKDKIKGIFFGQAIGDALGLGTEFMTKAEVLKNYPKSLNNYSQIIKDKHRARWKSGEWTDDTAQFLCIVDSLIEKGTIDLLDIAGKFKKWMLEDGQGIGFTTYKVLNMPQYELYPKKAARIVWQIKNRDLAPNGALMRNSIVCTFDYKNIENVLRNVQDVCQLTHYDQRCADSCKVMALIITGELNNKPVKWDDLKNNFNQFDNRLKEYIKEIYIPIDDLELDDSKAMGYTLKSLYAGLWCYYNAGSFEEGLNQIIMQGGDADTNGSIAGSVLGARFGFNKISKHLIDGLTGKNELMEKFNKYSMSNC